MQIPQLQLALHEFDYIPEAKYAARKIKDGFSFIDENRRVTIDELPVKWIRFWSVEDRQLLHKITEHPIMDDEISNPSLLISLIAFSYIYVYGYKDWDFADLQNFWNVYIDFQKLLMTLSGLKSNQRSTLPKLKAFDLTNLTDTLDKLQSLGYYPR